ncbi:NUDIX hydrolase [Streptomyces sp. NBC_00154]|uniref:NUDIX domain-containing protein n=1 Tax=Streptomyces sp. NBC_00154 TaxID=2975670 RepID=UPI00224F4668|nr:NUDIX hydrolase [Streptomyces sp. NBC_00154]MCX5317063.1 NUDIX hydrolase [Streptomyces sp. NBC_00154]
MNDAPRPGDPGRNAYLAEGNAKQARKRAAADALIRDGDGRLLLVNPTYKDGWDLPGGMAEANEPPDAALRRELHEELGLDITSLRFLCIDWVEPHGPWDDYLGFVFDAGVLSSEQVANLKPCDEEISEHGFFDVTEALRLLPDRQRVRAQQALQVLDDGIPRYLRNGVPC